ncbi:MAG: hypothetical protein PQJ58_09815, partial [Spirochaetales bacterium]|nr:hypothetical protein [Spirochaetales bacterium]
YITCLSGSKKSVRTIVGHLRESTGSTGLKLYKDQEGGEEVAAFSNYDEQGELCFEARIPLCDLKRFVFKLSSHIALNT